MGTTVQSLKEHFDRELFNIGVDVEKLTDYWPCFFGRASADILHGVGIINDKKDLFSYDKASDEFSINEKILLLYELYVL
ncbi:hypothetical protein [Dickeya zeae]|uniref:hypothetical protein n=1 Tax=Dickeya zeae TaxID=204042 RepID=UPI001CF20F32|nr:hypothetical protein [Dickeya zeae]MCA6988113.1 hypothetical protein [Dickeya zeae]